MSTSFPRMRVIDMSGKTLFDGDWDGAPYSRDKELLLSNATYRIVGTIDTGRLLTVRVSTLRSLTEHKG